MLLEWPSALKELPAIDAQGQAAEDVRWEMLLEPAAQRRRDEHPDDVLLVPWYIDGGKAGFAGVDGIPEKGVDVSEDVGHEKGRGDRGEGGHGIFGYEKGAKEKEEDCK